MWKLGNWSETRQQKRLMWSHVPVSGILTRFICTYIAPILTRDDTTSIHPLMQTVANTTWSEFVSDFFPWCGAHVVWYKFASVSNEYSRMEQTERTSKFLLVTSFTKFFIPKMGPVQFRSTVGSDLPGYFRLDCIQRLVCTSEPKWRTNHKMKWTGWNWIGLEHLNVER